MSDFNKNVITLFSGNLLAQVIPFIVGPILTRLFTPEDFGLFALYMSVFSIIGILATGRYELAIILPKEENKAWNLVALSISLSVIFSSMTFFGMLIFGTDLASLLGNDKVKDYLFLVPLAVFLVGLYQSLHYYLNRIRKFKTMSLVRVIQSGFTNIISLFLGWKALGALGLIIGSLFGQLIACFYLVRKVLDLKKEASPQITPAAMIAMGKRYQDFLKFDSVASVANVASHQVIHILFNSLFSSVVAGHFFLVQKMLGTPLFLLAGSVLDVFKERAAKEYKEVGHAKETFLSTLKKLFLLSSAPSIILFFFGKPIFALVFGVNWAVAGEYAQLLSPMLFFRFMANPLSFMLIIGEQQKINMLTNMMLLIFVVLSFYAGNKPKEVIIYISVSFSITYILHLIISAWIAGVFKDHSTAL